MPNQPERLRIVVLISGRGSNLQALIDACQDEFPAHVVAVISNRHNAAGLDRAKTAGIPTATIDHQDYEQRAKFDCALAELIDSYAPGLVVLAGFMRILTEAFVNHYDGRIMNIHPSLLPAFPGLDTHRRALQSGASEHGATVHFVTPSLDAGPAIVQARVAINTDDDETSLAARVLQAEHKIYPQAVRWFAEQRLTLEGDQVRLDGKLINEPSSGRA